MKQDLAIKILKGQLSVACKSISLTLKKDVFFRNSSISLYDRKNGLIAVNAASLDFDSVSEEDVVIISVNGEIINGKRKIPREIETYLEIYRKNNNINSVARICTKETMQIAYSGIDDILYNNEISIAENINISSSNKKGFIIVPNQGVYMWNLKPFDLVSDIDKIRQICSSVSVSCGIKKDLNIKNLYDEARDVYSSQIEENADISNCNVSTEEQKVINLDMLKYFDKVCRKNEIRYSLTGGTLLGAVRHRGFIPWDDDVDVFLTRPEYDKLINAFSDENRYVFVCREKEPSFPYVYGRIIDTHTMIEKSPNTLSAGKGLFIDVCVVDGLPKISWIRKIYAKKMRILFRLRRSTIHDKKSISYSRKGPIIRFLKDIVCKLSSTEDWNRIIYRNIHKYKFDNCEWVGNFTSQYGIKEMLHKSAFDDYMDIEFEGYQFMICKGYEEYLNNIYNNYMALPAEKKRKGHHPNKCVWK